jgi:hypothetical protein
MSPLSVYRSDIVGRAQIRLDCFFCAHLVEFSFTMSLPRFMSRINRLHSLFLTIPRHSYVLLCIFHGDDHVSHCLAGGSWLTAHLYQKPPASMRQRAKHHCTALDTLVMVCIAFAYRHRPTTNQIHKNIQKYTLLFARYPLSCILEYPHTHTSCRTTSPAQSTCVSAIPALSAKGTYTLCSYTMLRINCARGLYLSDPTIFLRWPGPGCTPAEQGLHEQREGEAHERPRTLPHVHSGLGGIRSLVCVPMRSAWC